ATIALPDSVDKFYSGVNKGLEKTGDGIGRLTERSPDAKARGGALDGLLPGTAVVVHYTVKGIPSSADAVRPSNEGTIIGVDRSKARITVRFSAGSTETFRSAPVSREPFGPGNEPDPKDSRVIVYRATEPGPRTAHFFKPVH